MNINQQLLEHFRTGAGPAAKYLKNRVWGLTEQLESFFAVRSDIKRIIESEQIATAILETLDYKEISILRKAVATLEINRTINYKKQTDHTAHTLYLFLLGVYMYDSVERIRTAIDDQIASESNKEKMFVFRWLFASLLHDLGYLYYDKDFKTHGKIYDNMFADAFELEFTPLKDELKDSVKSYWEGFKNKFGTVNTANSQEPKDVLEELSKVPWIKEVLGIESENGFKILQNDLIETDLKEFAYRIAEDGYDNKNPDKRVDHAIASGLMLLQFTSIWYWMYKQVKGTHLNKELHKYFTYPEEVLWKHVIPACRAAAYHNIPKIQFTLEQDSLLYLAVLCDELQVWDRFVVGQEHLTEWQIAETHCMAENVIVSTEQAGDYVSFTYEYQFYRNKVKNALDNRLNSWEKYIKL